MPSEIYENYENYDDRLNNIKTWPNFKTISYSSGLYTDNTNCKISDNNYVICVKKSFSQREEEFFNGDIPLDRNDYIRRIDASSFITTDNIVDSLYGDDSSEIVSDNGASPPPYIPNTYAIRQRITSHMWKWIPAVKSGGVSPNVPSAGAIKNIMTNYNTFWNKTGTSAPSTEPDDVSQDTYKEHFIPTVGAIQDMIKSVVYGSYTDNAKVIPNIKAIQDMVSSSIFSVSDSSHKVPSVKAIDDMVSATVVNNALSPNDSFHVPTNSAINTLLSSFSGGYAADAVYYNSTSGFYAINPSYINTLNDPKVFLTATQMWELGYGRWW